MSHLTIYLADAQEAQLRARAASEGLSLSRWIARAVSQQTQTVWPAHVAALAGAWGDVQLTERSTVSDLPRETL